MRQVVFENIARRQFFEWEKKDKKIFIKIAQLIDECRKEPFTGTGKPEALKHQLKGYWSRRITHEHRLIYKVTETQIIVIACKYHY